MANEKKPSIYVDRGDIGSSSELDEYGVWIKSEPQDLSLAGAEIQEPADLSAADDLDLDISGIGDLPDFDLDAEETSETADSGGADFEAAADIGGDDFELPSFSEDDAAVEETSELEADFGIPEESETGSPDFGDFLENAETSGADSDELESLSFEQDNAGTEEEPPYIDLDIDIPDFSESAETENGLTPDADFIEETSVDLDLSDDLPDAGPLKTAPAEIEESETEILDFNEFPEDLSAADGEPEEIAETKPAESEAKTGAPDLSTQLLMKIAEELSSIRTELSTLKKDFSVIKAAAPQTETEEKSFFGGEDDEKIALTGDELNNILNTADFTEEAGADANIDLSDDAEYIPLDVKETDNIPADDIPSVAESETDDETLSIKDLDINLDEANLDELGGEAELDSADGTLESADLDISPEEETLPAETDDEIADLSLDEETLPTETDNEITPDEMNVLDELPGGESFDLSLDDTNEELFSGIAEEPLPDFTVEENDELKELREKGAEPMAFAPDPEDDNYLTEDPLAGDLLAEEISGGEDLSLQPPDEPSDEMNGESIDLSDAVIDEPDLSAEIQENPIEEPSLEDISISLDIDEASFAASSEEESSVESMDIDELPEEILTIPEDFPELPEEETVEDEIPLSFETDDISGDNKEGGDLSLIPEGFVVESDESPIFPEINEETDSSAEETDIPDAGLEDIFEEIPPAAEETVIPEAADDVGTIPPKLKQELKTVLSYMDQLLESLPDNKIEEFARSEYYDTYKKLFSELGLM